MDRTRNRQLAIEGTQRWMLAGMAGMAAAMLVSFAGMLDLLPPAAESLAVFVCGWAVFALLAPRAIMLELERDDRPTIARLAERARAVADGDRRVPLQSLALDRDDELGMLSRVVHDLAAAAHAHRQQARLMKRRMGHHVRLETHKATFHLQREAMTDPLTGLGNRRALRRHVDRLIARHGAGAMVTVMLVDVDRFKHVNDAFGHGAGDRCLMFLSEVLRSCLRKHDVLIRMGGDEFAVIMPLVDVASVRPAAQRLAGVFGQMPWPHGTASRPTLSIGIAQGLAGELLDAATLLTRADAALYDAKRAGRSAIVNSP
jgi:diguanylate cyclase (GGDEF)-like protein